MPQNISVEIVIVLLGAILILGGIVGEDFNLPGNTTIPGIKKSALRFIAVVLGVALIVVALAPSDFLSNSEKPEPPTSKVISVEPNLSSPEPIPNLSISKGDTVIVRPEDASTWNCGGGGKDEDWVGPGGNSNYKSDSRHRLGSAPFCSLIGRVGNGKWHNFGAEDSFTADSSGSLVLTANDVIPEYCPLPDTNQCYRDNKGVISVTVAVEE